MSQHKLQVVAGVLAVLAAAVGLITAIVTAKGDSGSSPEATEPARVAVPKVADVIRERDCQQRTGAASSCEVSSRENARAVNERAQKARLAGDHARAQCFAHAAACRALYDEGARDERIVAAALYELAYAHVHTGQSERAVPLLWEAARLRARAGQHRTLGRVCALLRSADPARVSPDCPASARSANP